MSIRRIQQNNQLLLVLAILSLIIASLACNFRGSVSTPPPTPIPVSTQAVQEMATEVVSAATQVAAGQPVTLEFTEQELTSAATLEMQKQNDYQVQNIQVRLRNGMIQITGDVSQSGLNLPLAISLKVTPDANGVPKATVVNAKVGPLPLPQNMTSEIEKNFNDTIESQLAAAGNNLRVDSITIADGKMTIQAHPG